MIGVNLNWPLESVIIDCRKKCLSYRHRHRGF